MDLGVGTDIGENQGKERQARWHETQEGESVDHNITLSWAYVF